jgi:hypothetical protein
MLQARTNCLSQFYSNSPSHSFIFSANDDIWKDYFSVEDLKEIKASIEAKKSLRRYAKAFS